MKFSDTVAMLLSAKKSQTSVSRLATPPVEPEILASPQPIVAPTPMHKITSVSSTHSLLSMESLAQEQQNRSVLTPAHKSSSVSASHEGFP